MEKSQEPNNNRVKLTQAVYDGLETIRQTGATNMLDRPVVLQLAREWNLTETADWIEQTDLETYGRLIHSGPEVIEAETLDEKLDRYDREYDEERRAFWVGPSPSPVTNVAEFTARHSSTPERMPVASPLAKLGHLAAVTLADTYETEQMGVVFGASLDRINEERTILLRNLVEAANLGAQFEDTVAEIERSTASLQSLIDPESY